MLYPRVCRKSSTPQQPHLKLLLCPGFSLLPCSLQGLTIQLLLVLLHFLLHLLPQLLNKCSLVRLNLNNTLNDLQQHNKGRAQFQTGATDRRVCFGP